MIEGLDWADAEDLSFFSPWETEASLPGEQLQTAENKDPAPATGELLGAADQLSSRLEELNLSEHDPEEIGLGFQVDQLA